MNHKHSCTNENINISSGILRVECNIPEIRRNICSPIRK